MRLPVVVKVGFFALLVMGVYTYYANSIPQIQSKPPEELSLEGGNVTPQQLIAAGETIFKGKGTCEICHRIGQAGARAPDLSGIGARAATRRPGMSAKAYIIESLLDPGTYVVEGYPAIMPKVDKPPIGLNRSELWAVAAFLESLGGTVNVKLEDVPATVGGGGGGAETAATALALPGNPKAGREVFFKKGAPPCSTCHRIGGEGGQVGPDLSSIGAIQTPEYIMGKILDPASKGTVAGYPAGVMPPIFGQQLTARDYMDLVAFLLQQKGGGPAAKK